MKVFIHLSLLLMVTSCAYVQSVSQTNIPKGKGRVVNAEVENNIIFLANFKNDYINEVTTKLIEKCPKGTISGLLTKHETKVYFPIIYYKEVITAQGYCNE
jgi:hypothetical protein